MWQCEFCNYTSIKKWNVKLHEKRKHSTKIENLNKEVKNNQINNKEIKVEEAPLLVIKKPAHNATIKNPMKSVLLKNKTEQYINDLRRRVRLKKLLKKGSSSLQMKRKQKRKIIQDCCSSLSKIIKELKIIDSLRVPKRNYLVELITDQYNV
jgi:hypothetical protein